MGLRHSAVVRHVLWLLAVLVVRAAGQGAIVNPAVITTTEGAAGVTFQVTLTGGPVSAMGTVFVDFDVGNLAEGAINPVRMTFTDLNWNVAQTGTVTGVRDSKIDGNVIYTITTLMTSATDFAFNNVPIPDILVTNNNVDTAGVNSQILTNPMITTEAGGNADVQFTLSAQPANDVVFSVSSSNTLEGTVNPTALTFTPATWNVAQNVQVTGANDLIDDGDVAYTITFGSTSSLDPNFNNLPVAAVAVTNLDDDTRGFDIDPVPGMGGVTTGETGRVATITIALTSQPTATVTIAVTSSDTSEATVSPALLTFFPATYAVKQTLTVMGENDVVDDGDQAYLIQLQPAAGGDYQGLDPTDIQGLNVDDDTAAVVVTPADAMSSTTSTLRVVEGVATPARFSVVLATQPSGTVRIPVFSEDLSEGTLTVQEVVFTTTTWNIPQPVAVSSVDDNLVDGDVQFKVALSAAVGGGYDGIRTADDVFVTCVDDDRAAVVYNNNPALSATQISLSVSEANLGATAEFTLRLASQPNGQVTFPITSTDVTEGTVSVREITFTPSTWATQQTIRLTPVDDKFDDGDVPYFVSIGIPSSAPADPLYLALDPDDVAATTLDDDVAGLTLVRDPASLDANGRVTTYERPPAGFTPATVAISLASRPLADVTVPLSVTPVEGALNLAQMVFTTATWDIPQTLVVSGVDDQRDDGDVVYAVIVGPGVVPTNAMGIPTDPQYSGLTATIEAVSIDDEVAGFVVRTPRGDDTVTTDETGAQQTVTVALASEPQQDVLVSVQSSNMLEATVTPATLTFTQANWVTPQILTVVGVNDDIVDGNVLYTITLSPSSLDATYNTVAAKALQGTNLDNDVAGFAVTPNKLETTEGGASATFSVTLLSKPTAAVTVAVASADTTEGAVNKDQLIFLPATWQDKQDVVVSPVSDQTADGDITYKVTLGQAVSGDAAFNLMDVQDVEVLNRNIDIAGVTVGGVAGTLYVGESGASNPSVPKTTFTLVLQAKPTSDVTIQLSSSDNTEGVPSPSSVLFIPGAWNVQQTVVIQPVDDLESDGDIAFQISLTTDTLDPFYSAVAIPSVGATNVDDDLPGVKIGADNNPNSPLFVTSEAGGAVLQIPITLMSKPSASVGFTVTSSDTSEGIISDPASGSFVIQPNEWNTGKTLRISGVDDPIIDGNLSYTVSLNVVSSRDAGYLGISRQIAVTNNDNDMAGIVLDKSLTAASLVEAGSQSGTKETFFTVRLAAQPAVEVTVPVSVSNAAKLVVSPEALVFNSVTWNTPLTVRLSSLDDKVADQDQQVRVRVGPLATGGASPFSGIQDDSLLVSVTNDDFSGVTVSPVMLRTSESSAAVQGAAAQSEASFTVQLVSQPVSDVTFTVTTSNVDEGLLLLGATPATSPQTYTAVQRRDITFTNTTWNIPQTLHIAGADDNVVDGSVTYQVLLANAVSSDPVYSGFKPNDIAVLNLDNDAAGVAVSPVAGHYISEDGNSSTFTVVLQSQPTSVVTVGITSGDTTEGTPLPALLSFPPGAWNVPQTVSIRGVDDASPDGSVGFAVDVGPARSLDPAYENMLAPQVSVITLDNDPLPTPSPMTLLTQVPPTTPLPFGTTAAPPPTPQPVLQSDSDDDGLPTWMLAFIIAASVCLCCLLLLLAWLLLRGMLSKKKDKPAEEENRGKEKGKAKVNSNASDEPRLDAADDGARRVRRQNPIERITSYQERPDQPIEAMGFSQPPSRQLYEGGEEVVELYDVVPMPASASPYRSSHPRVGSAVGQPQYGGDRVSAPRYSEPVAVERSPVGRQSVYSASPSFSRDVLPPDGYPQPDVVVIAEPAEVERVVEDGSGRPLRVGRG